MCLVTLTVMAQGLQNTEFKAVKYCHKSKSDPKWSKWEDVDKVDKSVVLNSKYIIICGNKYRAMENGAYDWFIDEFDRGVYNASARLVDKGNGHYQLYLYFDNFSKCYSLRDVETFATERSQKRSKMNNQEWILGTWKGKDDGYNYITIYQNTIKMRLHQYQAVYNYINNIEYQVDGNKIITNLDNGTITIDRSSDCLYFRGVRYSYDE